MPGTLLLADLERSNGDELAEHLQSLYGSSTSTPTSTPVIQPVPAPAPQPDAMQELGGHLQNLLGGGLNVIGEGLSNVGQAAANVSQQVPAELQTHVTNLLQPEPPPPPPAPAAPVPVAQGEAVPTSEGVNPNPTPEEVRGYITQAAQARGIDPGIALKVAQSEGGFEAARRGTFKTGSSWWPFQLHYGGPGYENLGDTAGMGNAFTQKTGFEPGDPNAWQAATDYALDRVKQAGWGDWYGAKAQGITGFQGVDRSSVPPAGLFEAAVERGKQAGSAVAGAVRGAGEAVVDKVQGAYQDVSQFGDKQLTAAEANAACGPAAAVRFAQRFGRNPTLREATDLASSVGWTSGQGMAGIGSEQKLLQKMGVETKLVAGPQWDQFAAEAQTGNPVTISTSAHYFYADGYNPETGQFHVGRSGTDLRGGKEWMTRDEIVGAAERLGGGAVQGALFANNPNAPTSTTQAFASPTAAGASDVPGLVPSAGQVAPAAEERGLIILDDAIDRSVKGGSTEQRAASVPAREETPLIQAPEPAQTAPAGPTGGLGGLVPSAGQDELGVTPAAFTSPTAEGEQSGLERFGRGILGGAGEALGSLGQRVQPALEGLGETVGPLLDTSGRPLSPGAPLRESIANAPVLGGALGLARGPMLLEDQELLQQATPAEIETARKYASLTNPNPTEEDVVGVLRGFRTGEAAAMAEAGPGAGAARTGGRLSQAVLQELRQGGLVAGPAIEAAATARGPIARGADVTKQFMLSNPATHVANVIGNTIELGRQPAALALGGRPGDALAGITAAGRALPEAAQNALSALRGEQLASLAGEARTTAASNPIYRVLGASDAFTRTLGEYQGMAAQANNLLKRAGIAASDPAAAEFLANHAQDLYRAGAREGAQSVFGQVSDGQSGRNALEMLFNRYATAKEGLLESPRLRDQAAGALMDLFVPFSGVPVRMLEIAGTRLPGLTQASGAYRAINHARAGNIPEMQRAIGDTALESMLQLAIAKHIADGNITGADDPEHPNAIRLGGNWMSMNDWGAYALPMQIMASFAEGWEKSGNKPDQDTTERFGAALNASMKPFAHAVPGENLLRLVSNMGQGGATAAGLGFVQDAVNRITAPGAARFIENLTDPVARDVNRKGVQSLWEQPMSSWPGLAQQLPPKIDPTTGEPLERKLTGPGILFGGQQDISSPMAGEIARLNREGYGLEVPPSDTRSISAEGSEIPLSEDERRIYLRGRGEFLAEVGGEVMQGKEWEQYTDSEKAATLSRLLGRSANLGREAVREAIGQQEWDRRVAAGHRETGKLIPQPVPTPTPTRFRS